MRFRWAPILLSSSNESVCACVRKRERGEGERWARGDGERWARERRRREREREKDGGGEGGRERGKKRAIER